MEEIIKKVCKHIPNGFLVELCMENGSAYVALVHPKGYYIELPDPSDKTITEQLNDALCVATGFKSY